MARNPMRERVRFDTPNLRTSSQRRDTSESTSAQQEASRGQRTSRAAHSGHGFLDELGVRPRLPASSWSDWDIWLAEAGIEPLHVPIVRQILEQALCRWHQQP